MFPGSISTFRFISFPSPDLLYSPLTHKRTCSQRWSEDTNVGVGSPWPIPAPLFRERWPAVHAYNMVAFNGLERTNTRKKRKKHIYCVLQKSLESRKVIQAFFPWLSSMPPRKRCGSPRAYFAWRAVFMSSFRWSLGQLLPERLWNLQNVSWTTCLRDCFRPTGNDW
jgi:hypothetical protein